MGKEPGICCGAAVDAAGVADVDAELVFAEASGDVGMGVGENVGVDAEGEAGLALEFLGADGQESQLGLAFYIKLKNAGFEGEVDLGRGLADAGEDYAVEGFWGSGADALQLTTGDDVKASATVRKQLEDGEGGVCFNGIADEMVARAEGLLEKL